MSQGQEQPELPQENQSVDMSLGVAPVQLEEFVDYFSGFGRSEKFFLPDGVQYIEFSLLNEGQKTKFQKETRSSINIDRKTDKASIMPDPSRERHALIKASVCDWNMFSRDRQTGSKVAVRFSNMNLETWLRQGDPKIIAELEAAIRKANPWMLDDVTVEDIDEQIAELQQLREEKEKMEAEKSSS